MSLVKFATRNIKQIIHYLIWARKLLLSLAPIQPRGHTLSQHHNLGGGNNLAITQAITTKEHHLQSNLEPPNAFERIILPAAKKEMKASNGFIRKIELL